MTTEWLEAFPRTVKPILEQIDDTLKMPLTRIIAEGPNSSLTATENAQPAILCTSIMILRVLEREFDFETADRVDITLGHSLGEFAALVAGQYIQEDDALRLARRRAESMAQCSQEARAEFGGEVGMVALVCEPEQREGMVNAIYEFLDVSSSGSKADSSKDYDLPSVQQVSIANVNSKNQIVLSGSIERIKTLLTHISQFDGHNPRTVRLKADSPFHSPLMKPATGVMRRLLSMPSKSGKDIVTFPGIVPCVSNVTARPFASKHEVEDLLARQCAETVQWHESILYLHRQEKVRRWVGIGPGKVGRNLVGKEVGMKGAVKGGGVWGIASPREVEEVLVALDETEHFDENEDE
ncbi:hypothetical protein AAFC00_003555 [Neodothiora populina]